MSDKTHSGYRWKAITPNDTAVLSPVPVAVYVGGAGDIVAVGDDDNSETFTVPAGVVLPIQPHKVLSTGTTASNLIALYN